MTDTADDIREGEKILRDLAGRDLQAILARKAWTHGDTSRDFSELRSKLAECLDHLQREPVKDGTL